MSAFAPFPGRASVRTGDSHGLRLFQHSEAEHEAGPGGVSEGSQLLPMRSLPGERSPCPERYHFQCRLWQMSSGWAGSGAGTHDHIHTPSRGVLLGQGFVCISRGISRSFPSPLPQAPATVIKLPFSQRKKYERPPPPAPDHLEPLKDELLHLDWALEPLEIFRTTDAQAPNVTIT